MRRVKRVLSFALTVCLMAGLMVWPTAVFAIDQNGKPEQGKWKYTAQVGGTEVEFRDIYGGNSIELERYINNPEAFNKQVIWNPPGSTDSLWDYARTFRAWERTAYYVLGDYLNRNEPAQLALLIDGVSGKPAPDGSSGRWYPNGPQTSRDAGQVPWDVRTLVQSKDGMINMNYNPLWLPVMPRDEDSPMVWNLDYKRVSEAGKKPPGIVNPKNRDRLIGVLTVFSSFKFGFLDAGQEIVTAAQDTSRFKLEETNTEQTTALYTTNQSDRAVMMSAAEEVRTSASISNSVSQEVTNTLGASTEASVTATAKVAYAIAEASVTSTLTAKAFYEKTWSNSSSQENTLTNDSSASQTVNFEVPPNSVAPMLMSTGTAKVTTSYDYPMQITYDVDMYYFWMDVPLDTEFPINYMADADCQMHFTHIANFGPKRASDSRDPAENLRLRQSNEIYHGGYWNTLPTAANTVNWSGTWLSKYSDINLKLYFADTEPGTTYKTYINEAIKYRPMSLAGANITLSATSLASSVLDPEPLYPLNYVGAKNTLDPIVLKTGTQQRVDNLALDGYNFRDVPYYGFNQNWGHWELVNANGTAHNGSVAKLVTSGTMRFVQGVSDGNVLLTYVIDSEKYRCYDSSIFASQASMNTSKHIAIPVTVADDLATIEKFTITGYVSAGDTAKGIPASVKLMQNSAEVASAVADPQGQYTFQNIYGGSGFTVAASYSGYSTGVTPVFDIASNLSGKNLVLQKASAETSGIHGYVTDQNNQGLPAKVTLTKMGMQIDEVMAGPGGFYEFDSLTPGAGYAVTASHDGYITNMSDILTLTGTAMLVPPIKLSAASATVESAAAPQIKQQPTNIAKIQKGERGAFWVHALSTDGGTLSYQWYDNATGKALSGMTGAKFSPSADKVGETAYYCVVTNTNTRAPAGKQAATLKSVVAKMKVVDETVTSLAGSQKSLTMLKGKEIKFPVAAYSVTPATAQLTWTSGKPNIVSINNGKIVAHKAGKSTVIATAPSGKQFKLSVTVVTKKVPVKSVAMSAVPKSMKVGTAKTLKGKFAPSNATGTNAAVITWKSSKPTIISVDAAGKLKALKKGSAKITMSVGGKSKSATVTAK